MHVGLNHEGYLPEFITVDGKCGSIDFEKGLWSEVLEPRKDLSQFRNFTVDLELKTIVRPTGADLVLEYLCQQAVV